MKFKSMPKSTIKEIAPRYAELAKLMQQNRHNIGTLAEAVGIHRQTLGDKLKSGEGLNVDYALAIAKELHTSVEKIF